MGTPHVSRDAAGILFVTVPIRSAVDQQLYVAYRATFTDENGNVVDRTGWAPKTLPANTPDIHVVLGGNEAGKSTSMAGIEDVLFGIPPNSPHNFLHEYGAMRVKAARCRRVDAQNPRGHTGDALARSLRPRRRYVLY